MAIAALDKVDFSSLPQKMATSLQETSQNAYSVYDRLDDVNADLAVLAETEVTFANMHADVRYLERQIRSIERELKKAKKQARRTDDLDEKSDIASDILILEDEYAALESQIPAEWAEASKAYQEQLKKLGKTQRLYRNALDDGYVPVQEAISNIGALAGLEAFAPELSSFLTKIASLSDEEAAAEIKLYENEINSIEGANPVKSILSKARRDLAKGETDEGRDKLAQSAQILADEISWRAAAEKTVLADLQAYDDAVKHLIGLRSQSRLPDEIVPRISSCKAVHKDISLRF